MMYYYLNVQFQGQRVKMFGKQDGRVRTTRWGWLWR